MIRKRSVASLFVSILLIGSIWAQLTPLPDDPLDININARKNDTLQTFGCEILVMGSGPGGCTVGARVVQKGYKTCLLEAGGTNHYFEVKWGALASLVYTNPNTDWGYFNNQSELIARGNVIALSAGKLWAGSASHNSMVPGRGDNFTYDNWGIPGWEWDRVLPFFKKAEKYMAGPPIYAKPKTFHKVNGVWPIAPPPFLFPIDLTLKQTALNMGAHNEKDANDGHPYGAWNPLQNHQDGLRVTPCDALYTPELLASPNLFIALHSTVIKVLFEDDGITAKGFLYNNATDGQNYTVYASKATILAGGAFNTPKTLMHSGIGPADHLTEMNIPVLADRPGVGRRLQDHALGGPVKNVTATNITTFESYLPPFGDGSACGTGIPGEDVCQTPLGNMYWFLNSRHFNLNCTGTTGPDRCCPPEGTPGFNTDGTPSSDPCRRISNIDVECAAVQFIKGGTVFFPDTKGLSCGPNTGARAYGYVRLSCPHWECTLNINQRYLRRKKQMNQFIDGIIIGRELMDNAVLAAVGPEGLAQTTELSPGSQYQTREELADAALDIVGYGAHPSGTCMIGFKHENRAVVDSRLRVIKSSTQLFKKLRVCDNSIIRKLPHSNSMWYALMIGEKCADMLIADLDSE